MARFGKCNNCWWWNKFNETEGICFMQSTADNGYVTTETSYCPDFINRNKEEKKSGQTLKEWAAKKRITDYGLLIT